MRAETKAEKEAEAEVSAYAEAEAEARRQRHSCRLKPAVACDECERNASRNSLEMEGARVHVVKIAMRKST